MKERETMKVKRKFTAGPWEFSGTTVMGGNPPKKARHEWKCTVASLTLHDTVSGLMSKKEQEANGRLIAVAPEMVDFIEDVLSVLPVDDRERAERLLGKL